MTRLALYRKYRSATLDEVIGQDHVVATIKGALSKDSIAHAYLFCGPRGTGKTSVARILARMVNQIDPAAELASELDIIEIDAASNRGIDEMRNLRDKITLSPATLRYKVYIIDEVHMLTREAFNALLKTLEEPPAHALFILATTEVHKLPDTVISRTQRFDFRPIGLADITDQLSRIAESEKIKITSEAIGVIARRSRGGFRDAISLLDQVSGLQTEINLTTINKILGISSDEQLADLIVEVATGKTKSALKLLSSLIESGSEPVMLTRELTEFCRQNLLAKVAGEKFSAKLDDIPESVIADLIESLTKALGDFKITHHYSLPLELAIYRTAQRSQTEDSQIAVRSLPPVQAQTKTKLSVAALEDKSTTPVVLSESDANLCLKGLSLIKQRNNSLYAVMRSANPVLSGDKLILSCRFSFHKERIEEAKNRQLIEMVMTKVANRPISLVCQAEAAQPSKANTADKDAELISSALEILGGEVV